MMNDRLRALDAYENSCRFCALAGVKGDSGLIRDVRNERFGDLVNRQSIGSNPKPRRRRTNCQCVDRGSKTKSQKARIDWTFWLPMGRFVPEFGGERGIRTLDTLPYTRFPVVRLRPLGHLSS